MIHLEGVRLVDVTLRRDKEDGSLKVTGTYELMSSTGRVLAKQSFNGYNELAISLSGDTLKTLSDFYAGLAKDINSTLGL